MHVLWGKNVSPTFISFRPGSKANGRFQCIMGNVVELYDAMFYARPLEGAACVTLQPNARHFLGNKTYKYLTNIRTIADI